MRHAKTALLAIVSLSVLILCGMKSGVEFTASGGTDGQSSGIAVVCIETESGSMLMVDSDKEYRESGTITVVDESGAVVCAQEIEYIKGRGNSSWDAEKKSYTVKLDEAWDMLGMGEADKWVLAANAYDATNMKSKICYDMSKAVGFEYSIDSEWVELYLNGEYNGLYLLCEKVETGENRIDNGGGFLIERDIYDDQDNAFTTDDGNLFSIHEPDEESITDEDKDYIRELVQKAEDAVLSGDVTEAGEYIDWNSFILRYVMDETLMNYDTGITSVYFYESDGKLYSGPLWDYDRCMGTPPYTDWMDYTKLAIELEEQFENKTYLSWYDVLYASEECMEMIAAAYEDSVRPYMLMLLDEGIDDYAGTIRQAVQRDMEKWDYSEEMSGYYTEFDSNVNYLKWFISKRLSYLDAVWLGEENTYEYEGTGEYHTVTFIREDDTYATSVPDGGLLSDIPDFLLEDGEWWQLKGSMMSAGYIYYPILEDAVYVMADW